MTPEAFRRMALALPETEEGAHHGHADFRVGGKVFATLGPAATRAMVRLPTERQADLVAAEPGVFQPSSGAWGRQGCTEVDLSRATEPVIEQAVLAAWRRRAPRRVVEAFDGDGGA